MQLPKLMLMLCVLCLFAVVPAGASVIWDFGQPVSGPVGSSSYSTDSVPATGILLTAYGFDVDDTPHELYWKNEGSNEHGLGLVGTLDNELTLGANSFANYTLIDVSPIYQSSSNGMIRVQSVTVDETWDLWGTNTFGTLAGATNLLSASTANNVFTALPNWGTYKYYAVTTHFDAGAGHANDNVLFDAISADVPEPLSVGLSAGGLLLLIAFRRRLPAFTRR